MSRTQPTQTEQAELMFDCSFCEVSAGEWCTRMTERWMWAKDLHSPRYERVREVIKLSGYGQMLDDQWDRMKVLRAAIQIWRQNIYGDTTGRYDNSYLTSRIDALLEQS